METQLNKTSTVTSAVFALNIFVILIVRIEYDEIIEVSYGYCIHQNTTRFHKMMQVIYLKIAKFAQIGD